MRQSRKHYLLLCLLALVWGCGETKTPVRQSSDVEFPVAESLPADLPVPRYDFHVGQHLVYRLTESTDLLPDEDNEPDPPDEYQWDVYVTDQHDDGSWRLYIRNQLKLMRRGEDGKPEVRFENDIFGYCDLHPDGSFEANDLLQEWSMFRINPLELFPPLPTSSEETAHGWSRESPMGEVTRAFETTAVNEEQFTFVGILSSPTDVNYQQKVTQQVNFDLQRGIPTAMARTSKADWSVNPSHVRSVKELVSVKELPADRLETFRREADGYVITLSRWWKLATERDLTRSRQECQAILDETKELITTNQKSATLEEIKSLYEALLTLHDRDVEWALKGAQRREELFAMQPLDWQTTDFRGKSHRLADYHGKVVVMDFWYRACRHCIDALPAIKQLAQQYENQDVVILGMNDDRQDSNARFVIDKFALKYPTLRAKEIAKQYRVQGWPTFIILDQTGRIAHYIEGNSAELYHNLHTAVAQLLSDRVVLD